MMVHEDLRCFGGWLLLLLLSLLSLLSVCGERGGCGGEKVVRHEF